MNETQTKPTNAAWKSHLNNWGIYAAAAGASLSMATGADASIIHGSLNLTATINPNGNVNTNNGVDFQIAGALERVALGNGKASTISNGPPVHGPTTTGTFSPVEIPRRGGVVIGPEVYNGQQLKIFTTSPTITEISAKKFAFGALIAGNHSNQDADLNAEGYANHPPFGASGSGFLGFKTAGGDLGWLDVVITDRNHDGFPDEVTLVDYAYNTVSGGAITAGETGIIPPTPEPGTAALGLLATGTLGLLALRRRRQEVAAN